MPLVIHGDGEIDDLEHDSLYGLEDTYSHPQYGHPLTIEFVETAGAGIYTGQVTFPARSQLIWVGMLVKAAWDADTAIVEFDNGLWAPSDIKAAENYPVGRAADAIVGGYGSDGWLPYFAVPTTVTVTLTTTGTGGNTGRAQAAFYFAVWPETSTAAAVKS